MSSSTTYGSRVEIRALAEAGDGTVGTGSVTLKTSSGTLDADSLELDGYGTVRTWLEKCDAQAEPDCASVTVTADWLTDGVRVSSQARTRFLLPPGQTTVASFDFEAGTTPGFDVGDAVLTPSQGYAPLGPPGNRFGPTFLRAKTGNVITMRLTGLPPHTSVSLDFLFAAIDSLDGTGVFPAGDFFRIDLDGVTIFRESFANAEPDQIQSYVPPVPAIVLARRVDLGFSGPGGFFTDSAYNMALDPRFDDWPHTASTLTLRFQLEGAGVQSLEDESWAIDNVRVVVGDSPRPRP